MYKCMIDTKKPGGHAFHMLPPLMDAPNGDDHITNSYVNVLILVSKEKMF